MSRHNGHVFIAPDDASGVERLFKGGVYCKANYGTEVCGQPAQWKIVMACCGASEFLCAECYAESVKPSQNPSDYFGCSACLAVHPSWQDAVKESVRL